jgi:chlorobactene glucosyltransferase
MLSLHPFQELGSFWERLIMPAGLLMIACAKDLAGAENPASCAAATNGQFILIRRPVYFSVGGHAAVAAEICEDKALAIKVEQAGVRFRVLMAEHLASTRMYRDFNSLWEGLTKNVIEILQSTSITMAAAVIGAVVGWVALLLPVAIGASCLHDPSATAWIGLALALFGSAIVIGVQIGTARHFRIPAAFGLLFAFGYTLAALLACRSLFLRLGGRVTWKGRTYDFHRKPSPGRL